MIGRNFLPLFVLTVFTTPCIAQLSDAPLRGSERPDPAYLQRTAGEAPKQRGALYHEDASTPNGMQFAATVQWRIETSVRDNAGASPAAVRADIDIPERGMKIAILIRRNADATLPATHIVEVTFQPPPSVEVGRLAGFLLKENEQARGSPLAGEIVKVLRDHFMMALSDAETDARRNLLLLKEREWFDVAFVYANGQRAILAIEKGTAGREALATAFQAWDAAAPAPK